MTVICVFDQFYPTKYGQDHRFFLYPLILEYYLFKVFLFL